MVVFHTRMHMDTRRDFRPGKNDDECLCVSIFLLAAVLWLRVR